MDEKKGRTVRIGGVDVQIVSEEEAEQCHYVICVPAEEANRNFTDNVQTECAHCGRAIAHRPYVPKTPPKICIYCAFKLPREEQ